MKFAILIAKNIKTCLGKQDQARVTVDLCTYYSAYSETARSKFSFLLSMRHKNERKVRG